MRLTPKQQADFDRVAALIASLERAGILVKDGTKRSRHTGELLPAYRLADPDLDVEQSLEVYLRARRAR